MILYGQSPCEQKDLLQHSSINSYLPSSIATDTEPSFSGTNLELQEEGGEELKKDSGVGGGG